MFNRGLPTVRYRYQYLDLQHRLVRVVEYSHFTFFKSFVFLFVFFTARRCLGFYIICTVLHCDLPPLKPHVWRVLGPRFEPGTCSLEGHVTLTTLPPHLHFVIPVCVNKNFYVRPLGLYETVLNCLSLLY